jgi:hypothetical protein
MQVVFVSSQSRRSEQNSTLKHILRLSRTYTCVCEKPSFTRPVSINLQKKEEEEEERERERETYYYLSNDFWLAEGFEEKGEEAADEKD